MKQDETRITVGVDVSKHRLEVFELGAGEAYSIPNSLKAVEQWLDRFQAPIRALNRVPELCLFAYCRGGHTTAVAEYPDNVEPNTQISKAPAPFCAHD